MDVLSRPAVLASARATSLRFRNSAVISSASISFNPKPNRCGASRLSGRVTTSPPNPADPWDVHGKSSNCPSTRLRFRDSSRGRPNRPARRTCFQRRRCVEICVGISDDPGELRGRIPANDVRRRVRRIPIAMSGANLLCKRLRDPFVDRVRRKRSIHQLRPALNGRGQEAHDHCDSIHILFPLPKAGLVSQLSKRMWTSH